MMRRIAATLGAVASFASAHAVAQSAPEARALTLGPRVQWQFDSGLSLYAAGGYSGTNHLYRRVGATFAIPDFTTGEPRHDEWFYGAGSAHALNDRAGVQLDYRRLEFSDLPLNGVGLLFSYGFGGGRTFAQKQLALVPMYFTKIA